MTWAVNRYMMVLTGTNGVCIEQCPPTTIRMTATFDGGCEMRYFTSMRQVLFGWGDVAVTIRSVAER